MAARTSTTDGKKLSRKEKQAKRVREERADAFRRGTHLVLGIILVGLVGFSIYQGWVYLGRPGLTHAEPSEAYRTLTVYYFDNSVTYLVPVKRRVTLAGNDSPTQKAISEFAKPPNDPRLARIWPDIEAPAVYVRGREATVDLPGEIWEIFDNSVKERALIDALALTVDAAGECNTMRLLVDSQLIDSTPLGIDISRLIEAPDVINHVPDSAIRGDSKWVTSWFLDSTGTYLLPLGIEVPAGVADAEEAVKRLLGTPPQLAYPPPQPVSKVGCSLERLVIENSVATVNISTPDVASSFDSSDIVLFRTALYLTLNKCCGVREVEIELNGKNVKTYSKFADLPSTSANIEWNLEKGIDPSADNQPITGGTE